MNIFLIAILSFSASSQSTHTLESKIDALFQEYRSGTPGVAVAVVKNGAILFKKGYGSANLEYDIPISTKTRFHVASVSKQFTAFAIYLLADQGKINLDDDISTYFPELPKYKKPIRIRHLLAHTSGLRDQWALLTLAGWRMEDVITTEQILNLVFRQTGLNFEPGSQFLYSNTGYTLLARIVEHVTGQSFSNYTKEAIFDPLMMNDTEFYDDYHKVIKDRAYSYEQINSKFLKKKLNYSTVGATSLFTTVEDLAKWVSNFHQPIVGTAKLIKSFNDVSLLDNSSPVIWSQRAGRIIYHAKGQLKYEHKGLTVMSHGGHDAGFRAVLTRFPEHQFAVITLSNNEDYPMISKVMPVAELYLENYLQPTEIISTEQSENKAQPYEKTTDLDQFSGFYANDELSTTYQILVKNGQLIMRHHRLEDIQLNETASGHFSGINSFPIELVFTKSDKKVQSFTISNFGAKNIVFKKIN
ncbi:MAG: beta-lactamase family protein [Calditrichaeota bacterium]|nr:beta-lactamase family protein [Calditrichota bacterium]